jgi:signal peptidase I
MSDDTAPQEAIQEAASQEATPVSPSHAPEGAEGSSAGAEAAGELPKARKRSRSFFKELPFLILVALVLALLIKAFVVQAFYIPSGSMENTLRVGDRVLVNKLVYDFRDIKRGDIVVFNGADSWNPEVRLKKPSNPVAKALNWIGGTIGFTSTGEKDFIKRVIGVPGDHVVCCNADGQITVNGVALDENYLYPGNVPSASTFDVTVPQGRLWVMGDHRAESSDSRSHIAVADGTIPINKVVGRAFLVVWPVSHVGTLPIPKTFSQSALKAAAPMLPAAPVVLGLVGAFPITLLRRRVLTRPSTHP